MERERDTQPDEPLEMGGLILQPGTRIGSYVFLREVGSGGMARVLLAKDPAGELIALKVLRRSRFKIRWKTWNIYSHSHIRVCQNRQVRRYRNILGEIEMYQKLADRHRDRL